jgi:hypothetical protein
MTIAITLLAKMTEKREPIDRPPLEVNVRTGQRFRTSQETRRWASDSRKKNKRQAQEGRPRHGSLLLLRRRRQIR